MQELTGSLTTFITISSLVLPVIMIICLISIAVQLSDVKNMVKKLTKEETVKEEDQPIMVKDAISKEKE